MLTSRFETSCGSCHQHTRQIQGEGLLEPAVAFFRLPALDVDALIAQGIWIGDRPWPANANIGDEGNFTPFMKLLLTASKAPDIAGDLDLLESMSASLDNLARDNPDEAQAAAAAAGQIIWAIKVLLNDLRQGDDREIQSKLENLFADAVGRDVLSDNEFAALTGVPLDTPSAAHQLLLVNFLAMSEQWLPELEQEVVSYLENPNLLTEHLAATVEPDDEALVDRSQDVAPETVKDLFEEEDNLFEDDEGMDEDLFADDQDEDDDLFADDAEPDDDLFSEDEGEGVQEPEPILVQTDSNDALNELREDLKNAGRWHLEEFDFSLRYRPVGHADAFLRNWIDVAARQTASLTSSTQQAAEQLLSHLIRSEAPGRCGRCHSIDAAPSGDRVDRKVNWLARQSDLTLRPVIRFNHQPHLRATGIVDCRSCHAPADAVDAGRDPHAALQDFQSINKALCVQCHQPRRAGDSCLMCHQYHVAPMHAVTPSWTVPTNPQSSRNGAGESIK